MRTFIAIDLAPGLKKPIQDLVHRAKRSGAAVKWVSLEAMHLTLKFLGEIPSEKVPLIEEEGRAAAALVRPFPLVIEGTGFFPREGRPRVLWVGVKDQPILSHLQKALEDGLARRGFPPENRPFHPHLTLGRVKGPDRLREAIEELEKSREDVFGEMTVERLTLFESVLKPSGAEYNIVSEFPLS